VAHLNLDNDVSLLLALFVILVAASSLPSTTQARPTSFPAGTVAIGDSVMLGALPQLQHDGIIVDAAKDRAFIAGIDVAQNMRADGGLRRTVIIHLGANGPISQALFNEMMTTLHGVHRVIFLTVKAPVPWEGEVNAMLRWGVRHWRQAHLLDWRRAAMAHPAWLAGDGIHLTPDGAQAYAGLIARALRH
jgi:hypothetical protein